MPNEKIILKNICLFESFESFNSVELYVIQMKFHSDKYNYCSSKEKISRESIQSSRLFWTFKNHKNAFE